MNTLSSLWGLSWQRLRKNRSGLIALWIVILYVLVALAGWGNWVGKHWDDEVAIPYASPTWLNTTQPESATQLPSDYALESRHDIHPIDTLTLDEDPIGKELRAARQGIGHYLTLTRPLLTSLPFGADLRGRDVIEKTLKGTSTSLLIGLGGSLFAILIGVVAGAISGYVGGWVDDLLNWFYSVFTSIPDMLLLLSFAAVSGRGLTTMIIVMALTSWTGTYRLVRAEYLKLKHREYVQAAEAIGASHMRRIVVHIFPNILHVLLIQFSLILVGLIKYEAILSFLGFGVGIKQVSWGSILAEVPAELVQGYWWQMAAVTIAMSVLVTALSLLIDALRDAFDPRGGS